MQEFARQNSALGEDLTDLTASLDLIDGQRKAIETETNRIEDDFRSARDRLEITGTNSALGQILGELPPETCPFRRDP